MNAIEKDLEKLKLYIEFQEENKELYLKERQIYFHKQFKFVERKMRESIDKK